jgi:dTDP-4-amino-4,6-dideoxygalactose transaminase
MEIAKKHNLWVIEDCAQAHLAKYHNQLVGTFGEAATFSFYPGKNLGAMGDAGAIVTNNEILLRKMTIFARHGGLKKGDHEIEGINSRMDGIQAAILNVKIKKIKEWTKLRQEKASYYLKALTGIRDLELPTISRTASHVWHLFVIKTSRRDELSKYLKSKQIQTVINYPVALPFLDAYKYLQHQKDDFPNSYKNQSKILSLPIYPELTNEKMDRIIAAIKEFYR